MTSQPRALIRDESLRHALDGRPIVIACSADHRASVCGQDIHEVVIEDALQIVLRWLALLQPSRADVVWFDEAHHLHDHSSEETEVRIGLRPMLETIARD